MKGPSLYKCYSTLWFVLISLFVIVAIAMVREMIFMLCDYFRLRVCFLGGICIILATREFENMVMNGRIDSRRGNCSGCSGASVHSPRSQWTWYFSFIVSIRHKIRRVHHVLPGCSFKLDISSFLHLIVT